MRSPVLIGAFLIAPFALLAVPAWAVQQFYIGEPVAKEGMQIAPTYLTGVETDRIPAGMGKTKDSVFLQADIHATGDEAHGFPENAWIPYLNISFELTKDGNKAYKKTGLLFPMTAKDGPHYANGVDMAGPGTYHLSYIVSPPISHGLIRHVDKESGVPDWWRPITVSWIFSFPGKGK